MEEDDMGERRVGRERNRRHQLKQDKFARGPASEYRSRISLFFSSFFALLVSEVAVWTAELLNETRVEMQEGGRLGGGGYLVGLTSEVSGGATKDDERQ